MKKLVIILFCLFMFACASSPIKQKQEMIYKCTISLVDREISAIDAGTVCNSIYRGSDIKVEKK